MLINSQRFYERIQLGLHHEDEEVRGCAEGCMSFLVTQLKQRQIVLPPGVEAMLARLPEGER